MRYNLFLRGVVLAEPGLVIGATGDERFRDLHDRSAGGEIRLNGVPFAPGTEVEVTISARRKTGAAFQAAWERVCGEIRALPQLCDVSEQDIQEEIATYWGGR